MLERGTLLSAVTGGTRADWSKYEDLQLHRGYPIADEPRALILCTFRRYILDNGFKHEKIALAELTPDNLCNFQQSLYTHLLEQRYPIPVTVEHVFFWMKQNVDDLESIRRLVLECFQEREAETVEELKTKLETFLVDPISEESPPTAIDSLHEGLAKCYSLPIFHLIKKWSMEHALDIDTVVEYFGERYMKSLVSCGFFKLFDTIQELLIWVKHTDEPLNFSKTLVSARTAQKCLVNRLSSLMDDETRLFYALTPNPPSTFDVCTVVDKLLRKRTGIYFLSRRDQLISDLIHGYVFDYAKWGREFISACMTDASFSLQSSCCWESLHSDLYHSLRIDAVNNYLLKNDINSYEDCLLFFKFFNKWLIENESLPKTTLKRLRDDSDSDSDSVKRLKSDDKPALPSQIYPDGSFTQPHYSGIGIYFGEGDSRNVSEAVSTSSAMYAEMVAIEEALKIVAAGSGSVEIFTDSLFTINFVYGIREPSGLTAQYVYRLRKLMGTCKGRVTLSHVKGHSGNKGNDEAHKLAWEGRKKGMREGDSD